MLWPVEDRELGCGGSRSWPSDLDYSEAGMPLYPDLTDHKKTWNTTSVASYGFSGIASSWAIACAPLLWVGAGLALTVGVAADIDDENLVPEPAMTVYHPLGQEMAGGRLFIHAKVDPYTLVTPVTKIIRELASDQPVERAATLDDIRSEILSPDRVNALVFSGFAGVALLIAVVGVAGVLAFSVSARTREFGVRLAMGSTPRHLLTRILSEGATIGVIGIVAGAAGGWLLARVAASFVSGVEMPGLIPIAAAAAVLVASAIVASVTPAARAARVDVIRALRTE
jgi:putative ABC transport system permease protein